MSSLKTASYDILGVRIDALAMEEAVGRIIERAADPKSPACYVVKPYVEFLDAAAGDAGIRKLLNNAWLSLPDAVSTQWAAAYLYGGRPGWGRAIRLCASIVLRPGAIKQQIPQKFGGANFTWKLLESCSKNKLKVYLIGSPKHSDISVTARVVKTALPGLNVCGMWSGNIKGKSGAALKRALRTGDIEHDLAADLQQKKPDIVLVGMGFPLQEELIVKLVGQVKHGVFIGEGGTFDYDSFGGVRRKAPSWIQRSGLEWAWRLLLEPSRWRRQLAIPRFILAVYRSSRMP